MSNVLPSREDLIRALERKKYIIPEVIILGVRRSRIVTNNFDDVLHFSTPDFTTTYSITTAPGVYYLENGNSKGTAVLAPGQYVDAYSLGKHQGKYEALVQSGPVTVFRDGNKDHQLDYTNPETGYFGINIHRSSPTACSKLVHTWSAGCQVFQCITDYEEFLRRIKATGEKRFTYTLLEHGDV